MSPFASTAAALTNTWFYWSPLGKDDSYVLSEEESVRRTEAFRSCVSELSTWLARANEAPYRLRISREERVLELVTCMKAKGWHPVRTDIVVTSSA